MATLAAVLTGCPVAASAFGAAAAAIQAGGSGKLLATLVAAAARGAAQAGSGAGGAGLGADVDKQDGGSLLAGMEEVLLALGRAAGCDRKPSITAAKSLLRDRGPAGATMAARLSRLSKARNVAGHPDVALVRDIQAILEVGDPSEELADVSEHVYSDECQFKEQSTCEEMEPSIGDHVTEEVFGEHVEEKCQAFFVGDLESPGDELDVNVEDDAVGGKQKMQCSTIVEGPTESAQEAAAPLPRQAWADVQDDAEELEEKDVQGDAASSPRGGLLTEVPTPPRGRTQAATAAALGVPDAPGGSDGKPAAEDGAAMATPPGTVDWNDGVDLPHARGEAASSDGESGCCRTPPRRRQRGRRRGGGMAGSNGPPAAGGNAAAGSNGSPAAGGSAVAAGAVARAASAPAALPAGRSAAGGDRAPAAGGAREGGEAAAAWELAGLAGLPEAAQADALRARAEVCRAFPEAHEAAAQLEAAAGAPSTLGPAALLAVAAAFRRGF